MSFVNATLVLSIGETVEEVTDSGFLGTTPTLSCSLLGEDALLQVSLVSVKSVFLFNRIAAKRSVFHCIMDTRTHTIRDMPIKF